MTEVEYDHLWQFSAQVDNHTNIFQPAKSNSPSLIIFGGGSKDAGIKELMALIHHFGSNLIKGKKLPSGLLFKEP